ncbi:hypothetical protein BJX76DRAFT_347377 [Aspergillus varians]
MAGKCRYEIIDGRARMCCSCSQFEALLSPDLSAKDAANKACSQCGHSVLEHEEASHFIRFSAPANDTLEDDFDSHFMSQRKDTVVQLANLLENQNVVHVRGTPASGKTKNVFFINTWRNLEKFPAGFNDEPWKKFRKMIHTTFNFAQGPDNLPQGAIIIVDEAQKTYSDLEFWHTIIKQRIYGDGQDIKICLFCLYGSPSTGVEKQPRYFTPAQFRKEQRVSLTPHASCLIGLFFNKDEFKDAIQNITANPQFEGSFTLDCNAKDYLFSLTNGHPGGVASLLQYIYYHFRNPLKHGELAILTKNHLVESLQDDRKVWDFLGSTPVQRSFPTGPLVTCEVREVLVRVLERGNIKSICYINGWLHKTTKPEDKLDTELYVLPSRLHEKWIEYIMGDPKKNMDSKYNTLQELCVDVLGQFSACSLRHAEDGQSLFSAALFRPLEAVYQDEFYRAFNNITGKGVNIVSEWSRTQDGRVDFWISERKWAVKLLREENRVPEHVACFHLNGQYHGWIRDGMILEWIIINCTTTPPKHSYGEKNLIHAFFSENWSRLQIFNNNLALLKDLCLQN